MIAAPSTVPRSGGTERAAWSEKGRIAAVNRTAALEERDRLKETHGSGILDWGEHRHHEQRYEAYWRGMSLGLFPTAAEAQAYLHRLG
jgi:hypothetical protein